MFAFIHHSGRGSNQSIKEYLISLNVIQVLLLSGRQIKGGNLGYLVDLWDTIELEGS